MKKSEHVLYENTPSKSLFEAYPIGNGSLGCLVYVDRENTRLILSSDKLSPSFDAPDSLSEFNGEFLELDGVNSLIKENPPLIESFGEIKISLPEVEYTQIKRHLDLKESIASASYMKDALLIEEEFFASNPKGCIAFKVKSSAPIDLSVAFNSLTCPEHFAYGMQTEFVYDGDEVKYGAHLRVRSDGEVSLSDGAIYLKGATESFFCFSLEVRDTARDAASESAKRMSAAASLGYNAIRAEHIADTSLIYGRVGFTLQSLDNFDVSTSKRLKAFEYGSKDYSLICLAFNYGRYLYAASYREGSPKKNLYGIWKTEAVGNGIFQSFEDKTPEGAMQFIKDALLPYSEDTGRGVYPSLLNSHGVVHNLYFSASIYAMLLGEENGRPKALPTLPSEFVTGSFTGVKISDGRTADISFCDKRVVEFRVY